MDRRNKVELFEQIRREYEFGAGTITGVARRLGVHRRMVRQAVSNAVPPDRKVGERPKPAIGPVTSFIDDILEQDKRAPRKQRHTSHRIWVRLQRELPEHPVAESTVRRYVRERRDQLGLVERTVHVPQCYQPGREAQIDWYDAKVDLDGARVGVQVLSMRSMYSGAAFHVAYHRATQQALLEAHELAFRYFGGVFGLLRYDNMSSLIKRVLRGHQREETDRFIAFRSHWAFESEFCTVRQPQEKGGVEGEVGYFRRNHFAPVPTARDLSSLNTWLRAECEADLDRVIGDRTRCSGELLIEERAALLPLATEGFELAEESLARVDGKGCVHVRTNFYSTPLRAGTKARVRVLPECVEILHDGRVVARHERCYGRHQQVLDLEHYLDVLDRKPGALQGARPLQQWRDAGRWPASYDQLWNALTTRFGKQAAARHMIELLHLGREHGFAKLTKAIDEAIEYGCVDPSAVRYLITASSLERPRVPPLEVGLLERYNRPAQGVAQYDALLSDGEVA